MRPSRSLSSFCFSHFCQTNERNHTAAATAAQRTVLQKTTVGHDRLCSEVNLGAKRDFEYKVTESQPWDLKTRGLFEPLGEVQPLCE